MILSLKEKTNKKIQNRTKGEESKPFEFCICKAIVEI